MFTDAEISVLSADAREFPLLAAAQAARNGCGRCGHASVNIHALLRTALTRYRSDKRFRAWMGARMKLPVTIAGITVE